MNAERTKLPDLDAIRARAEKEPLGVDISDYSDEFYAGFLAGQTHILEEIQFGRLDFPPPALLAEIERLREIIGDAVPALGSHGRDFSQRALIAACEITGSDPADWTEHPDVLARLLAARPEAHRTKKPSECAPDGAPAA